MGLIVTAIIITLLFAFFTFLLYASNESEWGIVGSFVVGILLIIDTIFICDYGDRIMCKEVQYQKYENDRVILTRMLNEDYNPDNLQKALNFNALQKVIKTENESFWSKYRTSVIYVDTIKIPHNKFMPTQKIMINIDSTNVK